MPAPKIEAIDESAEIDAIDEPADMSWLDMPNQGASGSLLICGERDSKSNVSHHCALTPELKQELRRHEKEFERATRPAKGSEPRAIARLRLERDPGSRLRLIAWKSQYGELCLADDETNDEGDGGGGGPFGPCVPGNGCSDICLTFSGSGPPETGWLNATAGVFPVRADVLRITFDGGREATYELDGPLVPGFPGYRVFLLDLGPRIETRLELFEGEKLIAEEKRSDAEIKFMRCNAQFPPTALPDTEGSRLPLQDCLQKAGAAQ